MCPTGVLTSVGTTSFSFWLSDPRCEWLPPSTPGLERPSITIEPVPGTDGRAFIAYKVTNPSAGVWHYEYALYNQNLDRGIQSFSVPLGTGITVSNLGFHAPPNHPGFANDGTAGSAGLQQHRLDFKSNGERPKLELGDIRAEPERERDSLGHDV